MGNPLTHLQALGFSEYEARAYVTLLQRGSVTGYELAKFSGLPRANIYRVLQKLEERGAVVRIDSEEGTRYAPLPYEEFLEQVERAFHASLDATRETLGHLAQPIEETSVWNTADYSTLLRHANTLMEGANATLLVAISPEEASQLATSLRTAEARGVSLTTLCMTACADPCGSCRGTLFRYQMLDPDEPRWLVIVCDGAEVLAGETQSTGQAQGVRSRQRLLVDLAAWFIRHTIAAATLLASLNGRLDGDLEPDTRATLAALGPSTQIGWLTYIRRLGGTT